MANNHVGLPGFPRNEETLNREYAKLFKETLPNSEPQLPVYYIKKGKTVFRVLPPYSEKGKWFHGFYEHRLNVDERFTTAVCSGRDTCPICAWNRDNADNSLTTSNLRADRRFVMNVVVLSDPNNFSVKNGTQMLKSGVTVFQELALLDRDIEAGWGDITNVLNGVDIVVDRTGEALNTRYHVKGIPKRSNLTANFVAQGVNPQNVVLYNLESFFVPKTPEELGNLLRAHLSQAPVAQAAPKFVPQFPVIPGTSGNVVGNFSGIAVVDASVPVPAMPVGDPVRDFGFPIFPPPPVVAPVILTNLTFETIKKGE